MAETVSTATPKTKVKPVAVPKSAFEMPKFDMPKFDMPKFDMPKFEMPKFEMPKFDMPNVEMPAAFRELAEKGLAQAKDNYEKIKNAAEQATAVLEDTYSNATKGSSDYGLKLIENTRANSNAAFDLFGQLLAAKSYAEVVEKTTGYMRTQFDTMTAQAKELSEQAQKVATKTVEPIKETITTSFNKAAA